MLINATSEQQAVLAIQGALKVLATLQLTSYKYPEQTCVFDGRSYDYVIVGGGTAGCVLANRLVEDEKTTVLLIESGADPQIEADLPGLLLYMKSSNGAWNYTMEDVGVFMESHKTTKDHFSLGRVLGGSSSLSYLIYSPGSKHDYNNWAKLVNSSTWNWKHVLPYLKKSQRLEDPVLKKTESEFLGLIGNIGLTVVRKTGPIRTKPYFEAFRELGNDIVPSINGNISLGYTNTLSTISKTRQSTAFSYLMPKKNNTNLRVLKNTLVKRILFDGYKNAIGVEVETCNNRHIVIRARREVIISAGVINTPKLLMLSGIGPKKQLCKHKIHTLSDLPVGEGLQNHLGVALIYNMSNLVIPYRPFNPNKYPAATIVGYVALNKSKDYPDYQSINYINFPKNLMRYCTFTYVLKDSICNNTLATSINSHMIFAVINKQKFKSRGRVLLKSNDYKDDPLIYTGYYSVKEDLDDHAKLVQHYMRVEETETFKKFGGQWNDPKLSKCGDFDMSNLKYVKCYIKYMMTSSHEYSSTCPMGIIVDVRLRVYGVKRLRVVDASVMPYPTAGGTLGSTIMIAEKAADMIKEDWKKKEKHV